MYASMYATERNSLVDVRSPLHRTVASHSGDRWKVAAGAGRQGRCAWRRITAEGRGAVRRCISSQRESCSCDSENTRYVCVFRRLMPRPPRRRAEPQRPSRPIRLHLIAAAASVDVPCPARLRITTTATTLPPQCLLRLCSLSYTDVSALYARHIILTRLFVFVQPQNY